MHWMCNEIQVHNRGRSTDRVLDTCVSTAQYAFGLGIDDPPLAPTILFRRGVCHNRQYPMRKHKCTHNMSHCLHQSICILQAHVIINLMSRPVYDVVYHFRLSLHPFVVVQIHSSLQDHSLSSSLQNARKYVHECSHTGHIVHASDDMCQPCPRDIK